MFGRSSRRQSSSSRINSAMTITTIQDIQAAITTLSADELTELYAWLEQNCPHPFDERILADIDAGRLDKAMRQLLRMRGAAMSGPLFLFRRT